MSSCHGGISARAVFLCACAHACVRTFARIRRVSTKRGEGEKERRADQRRREKEDRQVTESSFTPFDSFAVRDTYALLASSCVCMDARTHGRSSLRVLPCVQVPPDMAVKVLFTRLLLALKSAVNTGRRGGSVITAIKSKMRQLAINERLLRSPSFFSRTLLAITFNNRSNGSMRANQLCERLAIAKTSSLSHSREYRRTYARLTKGSREGSTL